MITMLQFILESSNKQDLNASFFSRHLQRPPIVKITHMLMYNHRSTHRLPGTKMQYMKMTYKVAFVTFFAL